MLGDFGVSRVLEGTMEMARTKIGTPYYMAPEIFRDRPYSYPSDVWALGCCLYDVFAFTPAFGSASMAQLVKRVEKGK